MGRFLMVDKPLFFKFVLVQLLFFLVSCKPKILTPVAVDPRNDSASIITRAPSAPILITGVSTNLGAIALTWSASAENGTHPISDYLIRFSTDGGVSWSSYSKPTSTDTAILVTGLSLGISHVFQVAAVSEAGTGIYSASSLEVIPATTPSAPTGVTGSAGLTQVSLSWTTPSSNGGSAITDYTIQYSSNSGTSWTTFLDTISANTSVSVTGLTSRTDYIFRVAAVNDVGTGSYSANSATIRTATASTLPVSSPTIGGISGGGGGFLGCCTTTAPGGTVPSDPTGVSGTAGSVSLSWTAPSSNGFAITDYVIQYSSNNGSSWTTFSDGTSTSTSTTVTGLTSGMAYIFRVAAQNYAGTGNYSSNSASVTPTAAACSGDCYTDAQSLAVGTERQGPDGSTLTLQYANGSSEFKIWKEKGGNKILNASGLVANGWQKNLTRAGTAFDSDLTSSTIIAQIEGRVCPTHVFLSHSNMTATGRCVYYDAGGDTPQGLDAAHPDNGGDSESVEAEDWLRDWTSANTGRGAGSSYYEGNIKTCADKGMRLPVIYETTTTPPTSSYLPTDDGITPTWATTSGVPRLWNYVMRTASAYTSTSAHHWTWYGPSSPYIPYSSFDNYNFVRCVLPSH